MGHITYIPLSTEYYEINTYLNKGIDILYSILSIRSKLTWLNLGTLETSIEDY